MQFTGLLQEYFMVSSQSTENEIALKNKIKTGLTIFWNLEDDTPLTIDGTLFVLKPYQLIFLTEFHHIEIELLNESRLLKFNRPFYCINHNSDDDCNGILFFVAEQVPIINLPSHEYENFEKLWLMLHKEMQLKDEMQIEMLRTMLKQMVIYCTRLYKEQNQIKTLDKCKLDIVRKFNSLVEMHYKTKHTVADFADLLNRSPKTLSNLFLQYNQKTPLQIIQERILLEARRLLHYTDRTIKDITYELGFTDIQTFSRFFKNKAGSSPKEFRESASQYFTSGKIANLSGSPA